MTCTEWQERFLDSLTEPPDPVAQAALQAHLGDCAACRQWSAEMSGIWNDLGLIPEPRLSVTLAPAFIGAARARLGRRLALRALAVAASFVLVFWIGWTMSTRANDTPDAAATDSTQQAWLILLREPTGAPLVETGSAAERAVVAEYSAWAGNLAREGKLLSAEKLADPVTWLPEPGSPGPTMVTGYFLIRAGSEAEAERIARESPHIRHGGTIELRRIEPT